MSMSSVAKGLRSLAQAIDDGKVPESVCTIAYGTEPTPGTPQEAIDALKRDAGCSVTIVLRFTHWQETLKEFVLNRVLVGSNNG